MRHLLIATLFALAGFTLGCGSSDEGRTVIVHEAPAQGAEDKPAPAPTDEYDDAEFDDDFEDFEDEAEVEYEIERDD